jgi:hypothetical protein
MQSAAGRFSSALSPDRADRFARQGREVCLIENEHKTIHRLSNPVEQAWKLPDVKVLSLEKYSLFNTIYESSVEETFAR